jgi:hypothetical protein
MGSHETISFIVEVRPVLMRTCKLWKTSCWRLVPRLVHTTPMQTIILTNSTLVLKLKHA